MDVIIKDAIDDLMAQAEYNGGGIEALLNGRVVKSVQRGVTGTLNENTVININAIDANKSLLIYYVGTTYMNNAYQALAAYNATLTDNAISITVVSGGSTAYDRRLSWQVIEFY